MPFYKNRTDRLWEIADRTFNVIVRSRRAKHVAANRVERDISEIVRRCAPMSDWQTKSWHTPRQIGGESEVRRLDRSTTPSTFW